MSLKLFGMREVIFLQPGKFNHFPVQLLNPDFLPYLKDKDFTFKFRD